MTFTLPAHVALRKSQPIVEAKCGSVKVMDEPYFKSWKYTVTHGGNILFFDSLIELRNLQSAVSAFIQEKRNGG